MEFVKLFLKSWSNLHGPSFYWCASKAMAAGSQRFSVRLPILWPLSSHYSPAMALLWPCSWQVTFVLIPLWQAREDTADRGCVRESQTIPEIQQPCLESRWIKRWSSLILGSVKNLLWRIELVKLLYASLLNYKLWIVSSCITEPFKTLFDMFPPVLGSLWLV